MSKSEEDFWQENADAIVVRRQPMIAVYENNSGTITIRAEADPFEDDEIITIAPENLQRVIDALCEFLPEPRPVRRLTHQPSRRAPQGDVLREAAE